MTNKLVKFKILIKYKTKISKLQTRQFILKKILSRNKTNSKTFNFKKSKIRIYLKVPIPLRMNRWKAKRNQVINLKKKFRYRQNSKNKIMNFYHRMKTKIKLYNHFNLISKMPKFRKSHHKFHKIFRIMKIMSF